jgi:hypothetical protein
LEKIYYKCHFATILSLTEFHKLFLSVIWQKSRGNTIGMKQADFFCVFFFVNKSIGNFIIDRLTDRPKIMDESFTDGAFLSVSPSINLVLTE